MVLQPTHQLSNLPGGGSLVLDGSMVKVTNIEDTISFLEEDIFGEVVASIGWGGVALKMVAEELGPVATVGKNTCVVSNPPIGIRVGEYNPPPGFFLNPWTG